MHRLQELVRLHRMGLGPRQVARHLKMSPNTERRYRDILGPLSLLQGDENDLPPLDELRALVLAATPQLDLPQHNSSVARWRCDVEKMLSDGANPTAIFDRLRVEQREFTGTLSALKRMCRRIVGARGPTADLVTMPVNTVPGDVAQVDFGSIGKRLDPETGQLRQAHVFVMVLGFSRHMFARIVFDQKVDTWLKLHVEAYEELGGVPHTIVPDNLKSAVLKAAFGAQEDAVLNRSYRELARHFGFKIDPTPPRSPEKKGKVESGVKYVKYNFFGARAKEMDVERLAEELKIWVQEVAGMRRHGTTQKQPLEVFREIEQSELLPLPEAPWVPVRWSTPIVERDCHAWVESARYSAPWRLVGKTLLARCVGNAVQLYWEDTRVASHEKELPGGIRTIDAHLPPDRHPYRQRTRQYWEQKSEVLGEDVLKYVLEVFDSDGELSQLRKVQRIVLLLETVPTSRAQAACRRGSYYAAYSFRAIKNMLDKHLEQQALPSVQMPTVGPDETPRFARSVHELLSCPLEDDQTPN